MLYYLPACMSSQCVQGCYTSGLSDKQVTFEVDNAELRSCCPVVVYSLKEQKNIKQKKQQ